MPKYALGLDYGTESVRALLVDVHDGTEVAQASRKYPHGVIEDYLPGTSEKLPAEYALQHPMDYMDCGLEVVREVAQRVHHRDIVGIGVDFTACTLLPVDKDGQPLMLQEEFKRDPHAWAKLWKHHGAKKEAEQINRL